jgi:uncharacterized protein
VTDDHVTVTGTAERAVAPGAATWRAEAVEADDDPRTAFERCSSRLNALVERLDGLGEVATEAVVVQPRWDERGVAGGAEAIGAVRVRAAAGRAGDVAQAAMAGGADRLHGPRFEYDDAAGVQRELLGEAVADARGKAERLAAAGGRRLGPVRAIEEAGPERSPGSVRLAAATVESPDVRPRELTVTATVSVTFALTD